MPLETLVHPVPVHVLQAAAVCEPLPPGAANLVAEPLQTFAVPRPTIVCAVASDRPSEIVMLRLDRRVPVTLAPVVYRFQRTGETAFRREGANKQVVVSGTTSFANDAQPTSVSSSPGSWLSNPSDGARP